MLEEEADRLRQHPSTPTSLRWMSCILGAIGGLWQILAGHDQIDRAVGLPWKFAGCAAAKGARATSNDKRKSCILE